MGKKRKKKDMTAPRYGGRECLLWIQEEHNLRERASGRVQSGHDPGQPEERGQRGKERKERGTGWPKGWII